MFSDLAVLSRYWLSSIIPFGLLAPKDFLMIIWLSKILNMSLPDAGYSRNTLCALK